MKKITLTNATVIPFYKRDASQPDEIVKIIRPKAGAEFSSIIVSFNTETKVKDSAESKMKLFEKCTIFVKNEDQLPGIQSVLQNGAILEIEGYESKTKSKTDNKYYSQIVVNNITPISGGIQDVNAQEIERNQQSMNPEDLPF